MYYENIMKGVLYMAYFKLLPFYAMAEENKRRNGLEDLKDYVFKFPFIFGSLDLEVYSYSNFCGVAGRIVDLLIIISGNKYSVYNLTSQLQPLK